MRRKTVKFNKTDVRYWESSFPHAGFAKLFGADPARWRTPLARAGNSEQEGRRRARFETVSGRARQWLGSRHEPSSWRPSSQEGQRDDRRIHRGRRRKESLFAKDASKLCGSAAQDHRRHYRRGNARKARPIKLRTLTPEKIEGWRIEFIRKKATDPLREKSARISAGSFLLRARVLFATETAARVRDLVELPEPLPFSGIKVETVRVPRYRSTLDLAELLKSAREDLATARPEQYKIFLLGALAGLRRNEIDVLPWTAFRWNERVIRIETTEFYRPKSHNSEGDVLVDPELMEVFRGYHAGRKSEFVIESDSPPPPFDAPYGVYRCMNEMRALLGWLRSKGVIAKTPLHTLRKQFGSEIHARYGLLAASEQLRHGAIAVTARHYVENKQRSTLGFGHLLKGERTIISINDEAAYSAP
jgi:hypothetical protein